MQALFLAVFAAIIAVADQVTKYHTVTNIAYMPNRNIPAEAIEKFLASFRLTETQVAAMPTEKQAVPGLFSLSHWHNDGAAWSSFAGMQWLFAIIFLLFTVAVIWEYRKKAMPFTAFDRWCIAAIYGGGLGNMIDRIRFGFVIDMIELDFINFPIFNVADCFITCGCIALAVHLVFFNREFWKEEKKK